jgi:hypothetical protein
MRCGFLWPILSDSATLTGGSFVSGLPVTNLQDGRLAHVARTATDSIADATINVDLGSAKTVEAVALCRHNIEAAGLWRIRGASDSGFTTVLYNSGWIDVWPEQWASGVLPTTHPSYTTRKLSQAQIDALNPRRDAIHVFTATAARYWRIEIDDTANADAYIEAGRLVLGGIYQPTYNFNVGAALGFDDYTVVTRALSGTRYHDTRRRGRRVDGQFGPIGDAEALTVLRELQETLGIDGQFYWFMDTAAVEDLQRQSFLATFRQLSAVELAAAGFASWPFALEEVL